MGKRKKPIVEPYKIVDSSKSDWLKAIMPSNIAQAVSKTFLGDARMSNESLTDDQKLILWDTIENAKKRTGSNKGGTEYQDYGGLGHGTSKQYQEWFNKGNIPFVEGVANTLKNPGFELASTIGRGNYNVDPNDPNSVTYTDVYDWNKGEKMFEGNKTYKLIRNALRDNEESNLTAEKNDPYRMNFKLNKNEIDKIRKKVNPVNIIDAAANTHIQTLPFRMSPLKNGGWLDKYDDGGELDKSALSGVKNVLSAVSDVTSAPARGLTYLATGKYQDPSQAMGITNPIGAFLTDAILDPANLVGAGLATKVLKGAGKVNKVARAVDVADKIANTNTFQRMKIAPKNIPINPKQFKQASQSTIDALTQRGQELDRITNGKFNVTPDDIHYHGTFAARPIVEVKTPHGSEYFYKSTGWGGKKEIDPGQWQAFGQWMDAPAGTVKPTAVNNWFVKGKGFDNFYGSKSFGNVANSLDDALIKKYNVPPEDINKFLNFQNIQSDVNTFIPKRKEGGWLEQYNDGGPVQPNYNDSNASAGPGFEGDGTFNKGRNYSPAWGGQFAMGGSMPGSVGFMYARTGDIPSNGKHAKKTKASAQNGAEMQYYQNGLDWKPRSMEQGGQLTKLDQLTNFTNYNTKQPGGWLDKYQ